MAQVFGFFSEDDVIVLAGLTRWQLRYWDHSDLFRPSAWVDGRRVYSFRDLVGLRVLAKLKEGIGPRKFKFTTHELRKVDAELRKEAETPWSSLKLYVIKDKIHFRKEGGPPISTGYPVGQWAFEMMIDIAAVSSEMESAARARRSRKPDQIGNLSKSRSVMRNAEVIAGTRIRSSAIVNLHRAGYSDAQILEQYPSITADDVRAAIVHTDKKSKKSA